MVGGLGTEFDSLLAVVTSALFPPVHAEGGKRPVPLPALRGVLLHGPPGTGKTLLARSVVARLNANPRPLGARANGKGGNAVALITLDGPECVGKFYGESEAKIRDIFKQARQSAPAVLFIDEVDAIAGGDGEERGGQEADRRLVGCLVAQMDALGDDLVGGGEAGGDGEGNNEGAQQGERGARVVVIGATNRPGVLHPRLRRSGRFDKEIEIGVPNQAQRLDILTQLLGSATHRVEESDLQWCSEVTHGFVGADLAQVVREGCLVALRRGGSTSHEQQQQQQQQPHALCITGADLRGAVSRVKPSSLREVLVEVPKVRWSDIGGQDDAKQRLREAIEWPLKHPEAFQRMGISPPKGLLLYGPPGCSKTLLAKALATESGLNFLAVKGPELFSKWVGESEKAITKVFARARAAAPSIVFFDEIDAIGGKRGDASGSGVESRVLAQLLVELDGSRPLQQVTFIAATNRPDALDPALLRPGRIDRALFISLPSLEAREAVLRIHTRSIPLHPSVSLRALATDTEGYSGAELAAVCRESALVAMQEAFDAEERGEEGEGADVVSEAHFRRALAQIRPRLGKEVLAYFERFVRSSGIQQV